MDPQTYVVLENLPPTFNDAMLEKILQHIPCKGAVLKAKVNMKATRPFAQVVFEKAEDAEAAVKVWDQLTIHDETIAAWRGDLPHLMAGPEKEKQPAARGGDGDAAAAQQQRQNQQSQQQARQAKPQAQEGQPPRAGGAQTQPTQQTPSMMPMLPAGSNSPRPYPFGNMNLGWLVGFVNMLKNPLRSLAMCSIHEALMSSALSMRNDVVMEHAVMHFYTRFSATAWGKTGSHYADKGVGFELSRQVFEVLGLVKKYPSANPKSKKLLLSLVERVVEDVHKVAATSKTMAMNKAIPEILSSVRNAMTTLRNITPAAPAQVADGSQPVAVAVPPADQVEVETAHNSLVQWLKFLFSCLSHHHHQSQHFPDAVVLEPCSQRCKCYERLSDPSYGPYVDAEVAKVFDMLMITIVTSSRDINGQLANLTKAMIEEMNESYIARAAKHLHNGDFFFHRLRIHEAIGLTSDSLQPLVVDVECYDCIEATLLRLREWVRTSQPQLQSILALVENALVCLYDLRELAPDVSSGVQQHYTLQFDLTQIFNALAEPQYHLCVHVVPRRDRKISASAAEKPEALSLNSMMTQLKCANPVCPTPMAEVRKCSGCKSMYYCSQGCQRADWGNHKAVCKELAARRQELEVYSPSRADGGEGEDDKEPQHVVLPSGSPPAEADTSRRMRRLVPFSSQ